jgi:membrane protein implicated in regulation of membrane protease activity
LHELPVCSFSERSNLSEVFMEFLIYSICFGVGLVFTMASLFLGHAFGGHDAHTDVGTGGHADTGFDHGGMPGMSIFSPTVIASFLTALGALGMIFSSIEATKAVWLAAPLSLVGAILISAAVFWLFNTVFRHTQSSSESHVRSLLGQTATIITPIPANGVGEIAYVQAGSRYTAPARVDPGTAVPNGQTVVIVRVVGSQFYVQPI